MASLTFPEFIADFEKILKTPTTKKGLDKIGKLLVKEITVATDRGKTFANGKFKNLAPLKPSTKARKRRQGKSTRSRLRDTGDMIKSLKSKTNFRTQTVQVRTSQKEFDKSIWAHDGSPNRAPRPFIPNALPSKIIKKIETIIVKDFERTLNKKL